MSSTIVEIILFTSLLSIDLMNYSIATIFLYNPSILSYHPPFSSLIKFFSTSTSMSYAKMQFDLFYIDFFHSSFIFILKIHVKIQPPFCFEPQHQEKTSQKVSSSCLYEDLSSSPDPEHHSLINNLILP